MIDVHPIADDEEWNAYVERSAGGSAFHHSEFLRAIATETETDLDLLVGKNGEHPIGIFPVFSGRKGPFRTAFSPPPEAGIPHVGPATMLDPNIKYRKATKRTNEFVEACVEWIDDEIDPHYVRIVPNTAFDEVRGFRWLGFDVTPRFTYELDVGRGEAELLRSFSRDARTSIQDSYDPRFAVTDGGEQVLAEAEARASDVESLDPAYTIETGGIETVEYLSNRLKERFAEQGEEFPISTEFLRTVYHELPDGTVEAYEFRVDGEPVSGRISLFHGGRLTFWQGVPKPTVDVDLPINDLINWHSMREARERDCAVAELSGANVQRLWDYKAKFNPELATYYILERTAPAAAPALKLYKWWNT